MNARLNQKKLNHAINIILNPSIYLLGLLSGVSMVCCVVVAVLPISLFVQCLMVATIACSTFYYTLRDALRLLPWSWQQLDVTHSGELRLINQNGQLCKPTLAATTFIHPWLVVLNLKPSSTERGWRAKLPPLILLVNETTTEQHRQLRVWLRWWQHEKGSEGL